MYCIPQGWVKAKDSMTGPWVPVAESSPGVGAGDPRHAAAHDEGGGQALHAPRGEEEAGGRGPGCPAGAG